MSRITKIMGPYNNYYDETVPACPSENRLKLREE